MKDRFSEKSDIIYVRHQRTEPLQAGIQLLLKTSILFIASHKYSWLVSRCYNVLVSAQIAHELAGYEIQFKFNLFKDI